LNSRGGDQDGVLLQRARRRGSLHSLQYGDIRRLLSCLAPLDETSQEVEVFLKSLSNGSMARDSVVLTTGLPSVQEKIYHIA
jgi:hypothetical protein